MNRAAILGFSEYAAGKIGSAPLRPTSLDMAADLAIQAVRDAGLDLRDLDGLCVAGIHESSGFIPSTLGEYLGIEIGFGEMVDLGGASPAGMIWRAASAIEQGLAGVIVCVTPGATRPTTDPLRGELGRFGASSYRPGSPQAEYEIPYGHLGQNAPYAMVAQRYAHEHGYDPRALARLVTHQRRSANRTPGAFFQSVALTEDDVLQSKMVATPIRKLEIVMPVIGGAAVLLASADHVRRAKHRPTWVTGYAERIGWKSPWQARDLLDPPIGEAARRAFAMDGGVPADMAMSQIYDCYAITVLIALEAAGFCARGDGMAFLRDHGMSWDGDFPLNTNGGQLGYGQAGLAGGMGHVVEAARQIMGRADRRQVAHADSAFVMGNGGIMSEQVALILRGD